LRNAVSASSEKSEAGPATPRVHEREWRLRIAASCSASEPTGIGECFVVHRRNAAAC
jgi:hypothetical protein